MIDDAEVPSPAEEARPSRAWILPMLALVALAIVAVEWAYQRYAISPGVDPGDWIQRSFAWVGLPAVTPDAVGSPYLYPPVMFPILGTVVRLAGGPVGAGFVFGGLLLLLFGLSIIHVARRYFTTGPGQLLFVGLAVWNGTTLSILFWGGYPNFLAFSIFNEALVFLLVFMVTRGTTVGVGFWALASLLYLTHTLTFVMLVFTGLFAAGLLLVSDRNFRRFPLCRGNQIGIPILAATVLAYAAVIRYLAIQTPGYIGTNPTTYALQNLGQLFRPLGSAPTFTPAGPTVVLDPSLMLVMLLAFAAAIALGLLLWSRRTGYSDRRWFLAGGFLMATLILPAAGWIAHVDTDYTRFVYFFPEPLALGICLLVEPALHRFLAAPPSARPTVPAAASGPRPTKLGTDWFPDRRSREAVATLGILVVLGLLIGAIAVPTVQQAERGNAGNAHDSLFLSALHYLSAAPGTGCVLTLQNSVRWTEAVTARGAFDVGPTWLLFESWQIVNAEEAYWAFNSRYALTNNLDVLAYSGAYQGVDVAPYSLAPMYSVYAQGVAIPMVTLQTSGILVNATIGNATKLYPAGLWNPPTMTVLSSSGSGPVAYLNFSGPYFNASEVGRLGSAPGYGATIQVSVVPSGSVLVRGLQLDLTSPSTYPGLLRAPNSAGVAPTSVGVDWSDQTMIGPSTSNSSLTTHIGFSPLPAAVVRSGPTQPNAVAAEFSDPSGGPISASVSLATPGTGGNPAVTLPTLLDTESFLKAHQIAYMLLPKASIYASTVNYYEREFGAHLLYANPEWEVFSV